MDALSQSGMDVFSGEDQAPEKTIADTSFNKSIGDISNKFDREMAPFRQKEIEAAGAPRPAPPKLQESGSPPSGEMNPQSAAAWVAAASVLGMIAGRGGRAGTMNALAAFSGALEGLTTGNKEKFERESKAWEESNKQVLQHNQKALQEYKMALENTELDARQRSLQIQLIANKYHDEFMGEVAKHAAQTGDFSTMAIVYDSKFANDKKFGDTFSKLQMALETRRQSQADALERIKLQNEGRKEAQSMRLTGGMGMEGVEEEAKEISSGQRPPYTPMQTKNNPRAAAAMAQVFKINPDYDERTYGAGQSLAKNQNFNQQITSLNTAINHLDYLDRLGEELKNGDIQRINELKNRAKVELGAPLPNSFNGVKQYVLDEVAKAVVGSKTAESDRTAAQGLVSAASSPEQIHDAIRKIKTLMQGRLEPLRLQYESAGLKDFDKRLTPAAKEALEPTPPSNSGEIKSNGGGAKWSQGDGSLQNAKNVVEAGKSKGWAPERIRTYLRAKAQEMGIPPEKMDAFIKKNVVWDTDGGT